MDDVVVHRRKRLSASAGSLSTIWTENFGVYVGFRVSIHVTAVIIVTVSASATVSVSTTIRVNVGVGIQVLL